MSRYSSIASSSSRSVTKCSWLRSSRRSSPDSFDDQHPRGLRLRADQRRDRGQRVEQEVRIDLAGERFDAGRHQQLLLLLQPVLDPRAVPDLDRDGDAEHRRENDERAEPRVRRVQVEQAALRGTGARAAWRMISSPIGAASRMTTQSIWKRAHQPPHVAVQVGEEERREVPDRFLRADLAQPAAGKAAPDGEGQRDPLAGDERRDADHRRRRSRRRTDRRAARRGRRPRASGRRRRS